MQLTIDIDDKQQTLDISDADLKDGEDFFKMMDRDMDKGWQMSREWVDCPNLIQRCQIAANKMLGAIASENETLLMLLAGYILTRLPDVGMIRIATAGEMSETELIPRSK
ncbi:MAG: hypothetical protein OEZ68_18780 [Gammaproteobacteria bacterium]|nr:hypothetical protein [Gammaproteobacteria bacterium]MDH5802852.1 hypothetical protein [Gammaproteobacteria bacterium]